MNNISKEDIYQNNIKEIQELREEIKTNNCKWNMLAENQELKNKISEYEQHTIENNT
jgi:predicted Zn-dependent protease